MNGTSSSPQSCTVTMCGWWSDAATCASARKSTEETLLVFRQGRVEDSTRYVRRNRVSSVPVLYLTARAGPDGRMQERPAAKRTRPAVSLTILRAMTTR